MPMKSEAMRRAMFAAKAGKSTLGIPKSVGEKFVKHDQGGSLPDYARPKANRRDYPKNKYAFGGSVAPGKGPLEVTGHWGPKSVESSSSQEDEMEMSSETGSSSGTGLSGGTGSSSGSSSGKKTKTSSGSKIENW